MPEAVLQAASVLPLIILAAWLPGWLVLRRLNPAPGDLRLLERHFAALSLGLAFLGWLAFLLAQLGLFSLPLLTALWALLTVATWLTTPPHPLTPSPSHPVSPAAPRSLEPLLLALWLPAALWLFLRPHEAILGGADAGVYVSTAAHVARHGAILVQDPTLAQMDPALQTAVLRPIPNGGITPAYLFPGFNVADATAGAIIPDFFHFHSTWQAVAFSIGDWFGAAPTAVRAALLMPGLWALLGALAVYLTLHQALQRPASGAPPSLLATLVSALALAALSLNAIQVWFARYPVAESLSQYLLWTGLWALGAWLAQRPSQRLWGLLAALSLGLLLLTRIDMLFILAIPSLAAAWRLSRRNLRRADLWLYLPLSLLTLHAALHTAFISRPYFARIAGYGQQLVARYWPLFALLVLAALLAAWLLLRHGSKLKRPQLRRPLLALAALVVLLLAAYAYFLRPVYGALPSYREWYDGQTIFITDRENLVRLGWYLSPLGVWLGVAGAMLMIWRSNRRTLPILGAGLFFSLLYLWRIQANPHQIYVMRRYVPVVMPFFIAAAAYLLHELLARSQRLSLPLSARRLSANFALPLVGLLLALAWLAAIAWSARGFVTQVDYRGLTTQLDQLDQRLAPDSILLFDDRSPVTLGDILGTPLHYIFGHDVYSLRDRRSLDDALLVKSIESWHNQGRSVYWIGAPAWLQEQNLDFLSAEFAIVTNTLEGTYDHKPYRIIPLTWTLNLNRVEPQ